MPPRRPRAVPSPLTSAAAGRAAASDAGLAGAGAEPLAYALPAYALDGRRTTSLAAFHAELGRALLGVEDWSAAPATPDDLAAELDQLLGGFGGVPARVRLVWRHAAAARAALGHAEAVARLTGRLRDCPPHVLIKTAWALRAALRGAGPTTFDAIVAALRAHPGVELVLEEGGGTPGVPNARRAGA